MTDPTCTLDLRLLVDRSVVEVYAQGGRVVATLPFCPPSPDDTAVSVTNHGVGDVLVSLNSAVVATANVIPH